MKIKFAQTIRNYDRKNLGKDLVAGLIIMQSQFRSPWDTRRSRDCRQYTDCTDRCSRFFCSRCSRHHRSLFFGVDAAPAALIGAALLDLHIESGSKEALAAVPVLTAFVALWLFAFYVMRAGKVGQLYLGAGDGRLYHRHLHDYYSDAGAEASGRHRRDGRIL